MKSQALVALTILSTLALSAAPTKENPVAPFRLRHPPLTNWIVVRNWIGSDYWTLQGNAGTIPGRDFLGTTDNQPLDLKAYGVRGLRLQGNPEKGFVTFIGGSSANRVDYSGEAATIGGGFLNLVSVTGWVDRPNKDGDEWQEHFDVAATIAGGYMNCITHDAVRGFIGGGTSNLVTGRFCSVVGGMRNVASGWDSCIGGGSDNVADGGSIAGGELNQASGVRSAIGGGSGNSALGGYCTVAGGSGNSASGRIGLDVPPKFGMVASTVGGGWANLATETYATISGGALNQATGYTATVSGGSYNRAGGAASVGGGAANQASGLWSAIPGGYLNQAAGDGSFAAGTSANALHAGVFVWADSLWTDPWTTIPFSSAHSNEFAVRATGGARFVSAVDRQGDPMAGVTLAPGGGAWATLSDRNAKENFEPVDADAILERVGSLSISTWNYKSQDEGVRHIGPTAQDFATAFHVGENDTQHQQLSQKDAQLKAQEAKLQTLEQRLAELEKALGRTLSASAQ
jgi:hypothetical protein